MEEQRQKLLEKIDRAVTEHGINLSVYREAATKTQQKDMLLFIDRRIDEAVAAYGNRRVVR